MRKLTAPGLKSLVFRNQFLKFPESNALTLQLIDGANWQNLVFRERGYTRKFSNLEPIQDPFIDIRQRCSDDDLDIIERVLMLKDGRFVVAFSQGRLELFGADGVFKQIIRPPQEIFDSGGYQIVELDGQELLEWDGRKIIRLGFDQPAEVVFECALDSMPDDL